MRKIISKILVICIVLTFSCITNIYAKTVQVDYTYTRCDSGKLLTDMAIGDDTSVIVGKNGRVYFDNDGWDVAETGTFFDFNNVLYSNGEFVALSDNTVLKSTNGRDWTIISENNNFRSDGIFIHTKGQYVVEKEDGLYSTGNFADYDKISTVGSKLNKYGLFSANKSQNEQEMDISEINKLYEMIFCEDNIFNSDLFNKKFYTFINLTGLDVSSLPTVVENIEFAEINNNSFDVYYVDNFNLVKSATNDFVNWNKTIIELPEQNSHLSSVIIGKTAGKYIIAYDTNETTGIYKKRKIVNSTDLINYDDVAVTDVRGSIIAKNEKVFMLTSANAYQIINGKTITLLNEQNNLNEQAFVIITENADFMWKRENGIKLYWNKSGQWNEVLTDNFMTSHFLSEKANYQIIWTGENYIIRPTDYDNGYNPTGAKGNIEIYDDTFKHIKSVGFDEYILQMSYVDNVCYVLSDSGEVLYSSDFENWANTERNELPISNGKTKIYKTLTKSENKYDYIHNIKMIFKNGMNKEIKFENWIGNKVSEFSNFYVRYDSSVVSYSDDGVYWKDIFLPQGIENISDVQIKDGIITVITPDIELSYAIDNNFTQPKTYVEIDNQILGFDTPPIIESDRTLVPLRFIFETLGAKVEWENNTQTAMVKDDSTAIIFSIDNTVAKVNGVTERMDVPARLINDKTMVPLRFLSEKLGFDVAWNEDERLVTISR